MYNTYTLNGTQYYTENSALYKVHNETHTAETIETDQLYLFNDYVVVFDTSHSILTAIPVHEEYKAYPDADTLEVTPVTRVLPDGIGECPECGGWFGPEDSDTQFCADCGYEPTPTQ